MGLAVALICFFVFDIAFDVVILWCMIKMTDDSETMRCQYLVLLKDEVAATNATFQGWKDTIEKWDKTCNLLTEAVDLLRGPAGKWIPCDSRNPMPNDNEVVLAQVFTKAVGVTGEELSDRRFCMAGWDSGEGWIITPRDIDYASNYTVEAWKRIIPYEGENEG